MNKDTLKKLESVYTSGCEVGISGEHLGKLSVRLAKEWTKTSAEAADLLVCVVRNQLQELVDNEDS